MRKFRTKIGRIAIVLPVFFCLASQAPAQFADLVIVNGNVRTLDPRSPQAQALAVRAGRLIRVGTNETIREVVGPETRTIDAEGRTVLPGFNDSHVHLANTGLRFFSIDFRNSRTPAETLAKIRFAARFLPRTEWIRGSGLSADTTPTESEINAAADAHPLMIYLSDVSKALVNDEALARARLSPGTRIVSGADLEKVRRAAPAVPDRFAVLETALKYAAAYGVTSIQDVSSDVIAADLRKLEAEGKLTARVYDCVGIDKPLPETSRSEGEMVSTGCLKHYSDGDRAEIAGLSRKLAGADRAGVQVLMHAIGPNANAVVLTVFENVVRTNGRRDRRLRVEHAQGFRAADVGRFARLDAIASMQPALFFDPAPEYRSRFALLRDSKVRLAFGSDSAMIPIDPLEGIFDAVGPNGLTLDEALAAYTLGAAFAEFREREKGSIEVGRLADLVVTSDSDLTRGDCVVTTIVGGRVVFEAADRTSCDGSPGIQ